MALEPIRPKDLAPATLVTATGTMIPGDNGAAVERVTPSQIVNAVAPVASQATAIAGVNNTQRMTPLTVKQVLDNATAPSVALAQAWAESPTPPDPLDPTSKSSKTWAAAAADSAVSAATSAISAAAAASAAQAAQDARHDDVETLLADENAYVVDSVLATKDGASVSVVTSGEQATTAGGVKIKEVELYLPYLEQTTKAASLLPWSMRDDILSGAMTQDHTAALTGIFADATLKRALEFPHAGSFSVSGLTLPVGLASKEIIFGGAKFLQRADRTTGGQFLRLAQPTGVGAYGYWDDIRIDGGVFDLNNKVQWSAIAWMPYMRRSLIRDLTVIHRAVALVPVTLSATTDVFTAVGHDFQNGEGVVVVSGEYGVPGSHPGTGTRLYVINRTADTFQVSLTVGGAAHDFTTAGATVLVQRYVNWGIVVGGRDVQLINPRVLGGVGLYQDGLHIIHGADIGVLGGYIESGDDALALGFEVNAAIPDLELRDVTVSGLRVKANMATAVKVYTTTGRSVVGAEIDVIGQSGILRNGGVTMQGASAPLIDGSSSIRDIRVRCNLTLGSEDRTHIVQPFVAMLRGTTNCHVDGQFRILGDTAIEWFELVSERAIDCSLTGEITLRSEQMTSDITGATTRNVVSEIPVVYVAHVVPPAPLPNLIANPAGYGGTEGDFAKTGVVPTGWRGSGGNNGLTLSLVKDTLIDGFRLVGYRLSGTTTATSTAILCPVVNSAIAFDPAKPDVVFEWGVFLEGGALPSGSTLAIAACGLASDGNTILESTSLGLEPDISAELQRFSVSRTMVNAGTDFIRGQLGYSIPTGQTVDLVIWVLAPKLTAKA